MMNCIWSCRFSVSVCRLVIEPDLGQGFSWRWLPSSERMFLPKDFAGCHAGLVEDVVPSKELAAGVSAHRGVVGLDPPVLFLHQALEVVLDVAQVLAVVHAVPFSGHGRAELSPQWLPLVDGLDFAPVKV